MNRLFFSGLLVLASASQAGTPIVSPGANLTTGPSSNTHSVFAASHNPALANMAIDDQERWRMNYLPGFAMGTEFGQADNFIDDIDELIDILDDPSQSNYSIQETLDYFNDALAAMGDHGYVKISNKVNAPIFPLYFRPGIFSGTFFTELDLSTQIKLSILDDELEFSDDNFSYATGTSAYIKSGIETRFALGYGRELFHERKFEHLGGRLYGGAKLNVYQLQLSKQLFRLQQLDGESIEQVIEDEYDNNLRTTTAVGLDMGFSWIARRYRLGLTLANLNSPSFAYGPIAVNCSQYAEGSVQRNNCEAAYYFSRVTGEIAAEEEHVKHASATVDGTYFLTNQWSFSSAMDLAAYDDIIGTENQWLHLSTSYDAKPYWLPSLRVGYHKNLVGSELSSVSLGMSLFGMLTLDAEMSLDTIEVDESSAPRSMAFSLSFSEKF